MNASPGLIFRFTVVPLLLTTLAGCYSYAPVAPDAVSPGTSVRARITAEHAERVAEVLGRENRVLEGSLVERNAQALLLSVVSGGGVAGTSQRRLYQRIDIPRDQLVELETRRLDRARTFGLVGAAVTALGFVLAEALDDGGSAPTGGRPGGEQ